METESGPVLCVEVASECKGHEGIVWNAEWHPSGKTLASCGQDKTIKVWQAASGGDSSKRSLPLVKASDILTNAHTKTVRRAVFSPDGQRMAAAGFDGIVSIWSADSASPSASPSPRSWSCIANLEGHENEVKGICWSPDGKLLATCGRDKTVWIWEVNPGLDDPLAGGDSSDVDFECLAVLAEHTQDVKCVCFHPLDSHTLISCSYDDKIKIWKSEISSEDEWRCSQTLSCHSSTVWATSFSSSGNFFVSVGDDMRLVVHQKIPKTGEYHEVAIYANAHLRPIISVDIQKLPYDCDDDDAPPELPFLIVTCSTDRSVKFWKFNPDLTLTHVATHADLDRVCANSARWSPTNPNLVVLSLDDGRVRLLHVEWSSTK